MRASVADTSVLAAFLFREPRADEAAALLADVELFEPPLLAFELASVCRKKVLLYPGLQRGLLESLKMGLTLDIRWIEVDHPGVVELALERDLTTYDATFLWVSQSMGIELQTFDERLQRETGGFESLTETQRHGDDDLV